MTIRARFWQEGTAEPAQWQAEVSDGYFESGRVGLAVYTDRAATGSFPSVRFDSFDATTP